MNELRKKQKVLLEFNKKLIISGVVVDYTIDRVMICIDFDSIEKAQQLKELDDVLAIVDTHLGIKKMKSSIISTLNDDDCIVIENNDAIEVVQKREFVRVNTNLNFTIYYPKEDMLFLCTAHNLSAGGIAFRLENQKFNLGDDVIIKFSSDYFEKDIRVNAKIIKNDANLSVAKFCNLKQSDEDRIVKYVFKLIAKK